MASANDEPNAIQVQTTLKGITTVTINRPHRRTAVNSSTAARLYQAFIDFDNDPTQKVCILHGAGGTFCAGFDLHSLSSGGQSGGNAPAEPAAPVRGQNAGPMGPSRLTVRKPVIAAVSGHAVAGGLELSLMADMRVAEADAVFGVFCRRWGVPLIDGGTVRLQAIVGLGRALDMILTGRAVAADEALSMGLVSRVVPKGKSLEEATKLAESLLEFPQECMKADRLNCYYSAYNAASLEDALRNEFENGSKVVSAESIKGAERFSKGAGRHGNFKL